MKAKKLLLLRGDVLKAARLKIPVLSSKQLRENLDYAGADPAEAYRIGVEEAQREIYARLVNLKDAP
jgi:hypothetical protein